MISDRLKAAIKEEESPTVIQPAEQVPTEVEPEETIKIVTTEEELQAFYIIKAILHGSIPAERVTYRDAQTYFAVFLDNNNRKTVCRLYLDSETNKRIVFLDENKKEVVHKIQSIDDIYQYGSELVDSASKFL